MRLNLAGIMLVSIMAIDGFSAPTPCGPPVHLRADYREKSIELFWDSVPGAAGYNLYTRPCVAKNCLPRKINARLITSGTRFSYIWDIDSGSREYAIKGVEHHLSVAAVCSTRTGLHEGVRSREIDNCYFRGYQNARSATAIGGILARSQSAPLLPVDQHPLKKTEFISFMQSSGVLLDSLVGALLDPREVGGCAPVSTVLVLLLRQKGLYAYKIDGTFIKEFHAFAIVNIEGVEYVLDFTANQFVPRVAPVLIPRDRCFLDSLGRLSSRGTPLYQPAKIYAPDQCSLSDGKEAEVYRRILDAVTARMAKSE